MSDSQRLAVISGQREPPLRFFRLVRVHPVIHGAPCGVATIQFLIGQFARVRAPPSFGGEAFQDTGQPLSAFSKPSGCKPGNK